MALAHVLLLSGGPGVGKTTVVRALAALLTGRRLGGLYTEEIREARERKGFRAVTFDGAEAVMAHVAFRGPHRVGKYGVDVAVIDRLAESALARRPDVDVYLVDEIGKMECQSAGFVGTMRALLDSPAVMVATVARTGAGLIGEVKRRPDVELWEVTRANRDEMPGRAQAWVEERLRTRHH